MPEVDEGPDQRPDVQRDVERLVQVCVGQDRPVEQPRDQDQVPRARDRRELGDSLGDAEDDRLQDGQDGLPGGYGAPMLAVGRPRSGRFRGAEEALECLEAGSPLVQPEAVG